MMPSGPGWFLRLPMQAHSTSLAAIGIGDRIENVHAPDADKLIVVHGKDVLGRHVGWLAGGATLNLVKPRTPFIFVPSVAR
jgi:hypothetical protein